MKTKRTPTPWVQTALGLSLLALAGCSTLGQLTGQSESIEYKSTVSGDPLVIPPDLTKANQSPHYQAPEGTARLSDYAASRQAQTNVSPADRVLPQQAGMQVMRDGALRWLVVDQPAETLFPKVIEFWGEQGFTIQSQDPRAGLIQTDWAENRAKIPEGWLRSALGNVIDQVFDSGERDRFTTRMERANGKTEIYVSHQHMEETPTGDGAGFKWVYGKEDPGLNAAMLARLMVYLGASEQQAQARLASAGDEAAPVAAAQIGAGEAALSLNEPFDRAWRRVGVAIDSARFTVEDRNREQGDYYIRYLDTDTGEKIEQPNMFGRLFGSRNTAEPLKLRVHVAQDGTGTRVTVLDEAGQPKTDATAQRIMTVLSKHLNETR
ncbi:outer membrane protein assembly factor BamC [Castellaniella sp. S9]|uniref:outer membrane protein assembly factor BamC n=1 Tax=Castellaniella sp. S9 TaxID=2993652 RepID=UPI0022B5604B|nr:outer membrane protein assembly factor BamC [Castellaniella sp. S9]